MKEPADSRASTASAHRGLDWALHNPGMLDRQTLIERFLFRHELLTELVSQLRKQPSGYGLRHLICIGQRGMGKTTLLRRLNYAIEDDADLAAHWLPLLFNEEQYNVGDLADLFTETLCLIAESTGDPLLAAAAARPADENTDASDLAEQQYAELVAFCQRAGRRLVLLIDNINEFLQVLSFEESNRLREILMTQPHLLIIGAAPTHFSEIGDYQKPFYQFFRTYRLEGLSEQDMEAFLLALAKHNHDAGVLSVLQQHPERVRSLRQLTGGNPRIALYLYRLLSESPHGEIRRDLERLIDEVTPFYKHRLDSLEPLQRKVFDAVARHWHPITAQQLASALRLTEEATAEPLRRLRDSSHVEELFDGGEPLRFQVSERMCNIYYLMRFSRGGRQRLQWLVQFLRAFYDPETLRALAGKWVVSWEKIALTPQTAAERTESLFLIAQALTSADAQTEVLLRAVDFADRGKVTQEELGRILLAGLQDQLGERRSTLGAALDTLLRVMTGREVSDKKRILLEQIVTTQPDFFFAWRSLGRQYQNRGQHPEALQAAERLVALKPDREDAWLQLAECAAQSKDKKRAESALAKARTLNPSDDRLAALEIMILLECGDASEAGRRLTTELAEHPEQVVLWLISARLAEMRGDFAQALEAARKAVELLPDCAPYWQNVGLLADKLDLLDEAFSAIKQAVALDPFFGEARAMLGMLHAKRGEFAESLAETQRAVEDNPRLGFAWSNLSGFLLRENRNEEAAAAGARATELAPEIFGGWNHLGASLMRLGRNEEAEAAYARALALPGSASVRPNRGWLYVRQARWTEALADFESAVSAQQVTAAILYGLGMALLGLKEAARARAVALDSIQLDATMPELWGILAVAQLQLGNEREASESAARAAILCAQKAQRFVQLGNDYLQLSAYDLALATFDRALAIDSRNIDAQGNRAAVMMHQQRFAEAEAALRQLTEQAPDLVVAWHNLTIMRRQLRDQQGTIAALRRLTELEPSKVSWWAQLGALAMQTGNVELAQTAFARVLELDENREDALQYLGILALNRKELERAREFAERLVAIKPDLIPTLQLQAMVALAFGQIDDALRATRRCTELDPQQPAMWQNLASMYVSLQRPQEALDAMEQAVRQAPQPQNWFNLAVSSLNTQDFERAARAFAEVRSFELVNQAEVESSIGAAYAQAARLAEAHVALTKAVELNPAHPIAWFNLSMVELEREQSEAALAAFATGLAVNQTGAKLEQWRRLANHSWTLTLADLAKLLTLLARGTAQYPGQLELWLNYAWIAFYANELALSEQALIQARSLAPEDPSALAMGAMLALARSDLPAALAAAEHAARAAGVTWIENNLARFYSLLLSLASSGAAAEVLALVTAATHLQLAERLLPLHAALEALCSGNVECLQDLAPEVRETAQELLALLENPQRVIGEASD